MTDSPAKKAVKAKKPKAPAAHPPYANMIAAAIKALKDRNGSSRQAILKYVMANYKVGNDAKKVQSRVRLALKRMSANKKVVSGRAKGKGAGCFRLAAEAKKEAKAKKPKAKKAKKPKKAAKKPAAAKKPKAKKPAAKKAAKKPAAKKPAAKKPAKKAAKKPAAKKAAKK